MRTIITGSIVSRPVKLGEVIKWAPDDCTETIQLMAIEDPGGPDGCTGCACDGKGDCKVYMMVDGESQSMSQCCTDPVWKTDKNKEVSFCKFVSLSDTMESL